MHSHWHGKVEQYSYLLIGFGSKKTETNIKTDRRITFYTNLWPYSDLKMYEKMTSTDKNKL